MNPPLLKHGIVIEGQGPGAEIEYRLALVLPDRQWILAILRDNIVRLPRVRISRRRRMAEQLTQAVKEKWDSDSVVLDLLSDTRTAVRCAAIELRSPATEVLRKNFLTVHVDAIDREDLAAGERTLLNALLGGSVASQRPFSHFGWLDGVISWIESQSDATGLRLTGKFRQLNYGGSFSLIRFETNHSALWFKAVGEPNEREFSVTVALARMFPDYVPCVLATNQQWNAWLALEAEGSDLDKTSSFDFWQRTAKALAHLQIESTGKTEELLQAGCKNLTSAALLTHVDDFFDLVSELMMKQPRVPPAILNPIELKTLAATTRWAVHRLSELGVPTSLGHLDFNPGNIVLSPASCVFLDWAEAYVGNPFLTFEYLLQHFRRIYPENTALESQLSASYIDALRPLMDGKEFEEALQFAPLVAVFVHAVASGTWKAQERLEQQNGAAYLRSLARRMHREAALLEQRRELCLI